MRGVSSLMTSLPALDNPAFRKEALRETTDTLGALYLASLTKSLAGLNEYVDKFSQAYEKRRGGRGPPGLMGMGGGFLG
jgi:hypothetical protein